MSDEIRMPQNSMGDSDGEVVEWLVAVGATVAADQPVVVVETAKATFEVPSLSAGVLTEIVAGEGTEVTAGDVLGRLEAAG